MLRALVAAVENPLTAPILAKQLLASAGVPVMRRIEATEALPVRPPLMTFAGTGSESAGFDDLLGTIPDEVAPLPGDAGLETAADFVAAYRSGELTPEDVAKRVVENTNASDRNDPPLRVFIAQNERDIMSQAKESAERYAGGKPLGPLDGVPIAVKDEVDQRPYPTTVGTTFLGRSPAREDAELVARLRKAGALLIGKANMVEIGLGTIGYNTHYGTSRNAFDPTRLCGGSSSGPAAAVAAGLCPISIGADGGGSIRIPASLCGLVGLKATYGRVSEHGAAPLCWSLAHLGPIAASVRDTALAYAAIAGPDPKDANSLGHPDPTLDEIFPGDDDTPLKGVRLGVFRPWFEDAEPDVVSTCESMLGTLKEAGAEIKELDIPNLGLGRTVHVVTIVTEMLASRLAFMKEHRSDLSLEIRLNLALAGHVAGYDYAHAQRLRVQLCREITSLYDDVDVIVTPATARTAPAIPDDAAKTGESNITLVDNLMRYAHSANLTGLPAISFPAGYDSQGLPVGCQAMGRHWDERLLLRIAAVAERHVDRRRPKVHYRLLEGS
jgi:Asp-tRNA(Asn)/Glu-tRNA(Gln) amidotransferase A subunit family amidase